jgi:hypothetical protein
MEMVLDRGFGKPVTAAVIADVRHETKQITANMRVDEAARIYQDMINRIEYRALPALYRALPALYRMFPPPRMSWHANFLFFLTFFD